MGTFFRSSLLLGMRVPLAPPQGGSRKGQAASRWWRGLVREEVPLPRIPAKGRRQVGTSGGKSRGREHKRSAHGLPGKTRNPTYEPTNSSCRNRKTFGP